jgi:hypothetical protein
MVTICRVDGLRVIIFTDDHDPAHVHVFGDGHAKIDLFGPNGEPVLVWATGMKRNEVRRALSLVAARRDEFLASWRRIHGPNAE